VLLADDNPVNKMVVSKLLSELGMDVIAVSDGQEAVDKVAHESFDCVFMDIEMPILNGFEATSAIRRHDELHDLPIIALTGHSSDEEKEKCMSSGMNGMVSKPVGKEELHQTLSALFPTN